MQGLEGLECEEGDGRRRNILHNNKRIIVQMVWRKKKREKERKTRRKKRKREREEEKEEEERERGKRRGRERRGKRRGRENEMTHSFSFFPGSPFLFAEDPFF